MNYAVEIDRFSKSYGEVQAVKDLSLRLQPGEIFGFLGLNGAGKTTTIRALLGMIRPSAGSIGVLGQPVGPAGKGPWARVGYLVESPSAYPDLSVQENLEISRRLQEVESSHAVEEVMDLLGIQPYAKRKAGTLSTGNRQRLGLARAILHHPDLLILDEPANGLDPAGVVEVRSLLEELAENQGVTIFMSSHILTEVDRLATRIGIIHQGRLIEDLDRDGLARFRTRRLEVEVQDSAAALQILQNAGYHAENGLGHMLVLDDPRAIEAPEAVATLLVQANLPPRRLATQQQNLEDHFIELTGGMR